MFIFAVALVGWSQAQTVINEGDVSPKIIVKFYGAFPGSSMVQWRELSGSDDYAYHATFTQNQNSVQAWLDYKGKVVKEAATGRNIPEEMIAILDDKYGSYKVKSVDYKLNNITGHGSYQVRVKTKVHGEFNLSMDQDFSIIDNKEGIAYQ